MVNNQGGQQQHDLKRTGRSSKYNINNKGLNCTGPFICEVFSLRMWKSYWIAGTI